MKWGAADPGMDYLIQVGRQRVGAGEAEHIPEGRRKGRGEGGQTWPGRWKSTQGRKKRITVI